VAHKTSASSGGGLIISGYKWHVNDCYRETDLYCFICVDAQLGYKSHLCCNSSTLL